MRSSIVSLPRMRRSDEDVRKGRAAEARAGISRLPGLAVRAKSLRLSSRKKRWSALGNRHHPIIADRRSNGENRIKKEG